jgi:O-antigen ligase
MRAVSLMLFAYVWRFQDTIPILGKFQLPLLFAGSAIALFFVNRHPWRRVEQLRMRLVTLVIALLVIMVLGIPSSLWRGGSFMFTLKVFLPNLVFMGLIATSIRSTRDVEWYAKVNLYGAVYFAMIVNLFFHVGYDGRLGDLVYYDSNDFALIMLCTIPFATYMLRTGRRGSNRALALLALALLIVGIVKSGSRGGFLGFIAVMLYILLRYRAIPSRVRLFSALAGIVLIVALGSDKYWAIMGSMLHPKEDYNWSGEEGRREIWKRGVGYMMHHPLLGIGVRSYPTAEGKLSDIGQALAAQGRGFKWSVAHNSFIETGAELGVFGLGVFIAMFVVAIRTLARIKPTGMSSLWITSREMALAQMLIGSFVGFVIAGFFVSAEYFSYLYFLFGLAIGLIKLVRLRRSTVLAALANRTAVRLSPTQPGTPTLGPVAVPGAR